MKMNKKKRWTVLEGNHAGFRIKMIKIATKKLGTWHRMNVVQTRFHFKHTEHYSIPHNSTYM